MKLHVKIAAIFAVFLLIAGCNVRTQVETRSTDELTKSLKEISKDIKSVKFAFSRPDLFCDISMNKEPTEQQLQAMMSSVKNFVTPTNMKLIADKVKWKLEISEFHLNIDTNPGNDAAEHRYFTRYFKSYDASDNSEQNIDGYRAWFQE